LIDTPRVQVAVGMLRRADGALFLSSRPIGKPYAGFWEFPGGKLEPGESSADALKRELAEEINIHVLAESYAWHVDHEYPHARVRLHFHWVNQWRGSPDGLEKQQTLWVGLHDAWPYPVLPATVPLLDKIRSCRATVETECLAQLS
jgi:8-oxo-dGTP diphosphatase